MAALERDLEGVLTYQAHILDAQLIVREAGHARQTAGRAGLTATLRARTRPAQLFSRVRAAVATLPLDHDDLKIAVDVDVDRKRDEVFQLSPPRLMDVDDG